MQRTTPHPAGGIDTVVRALHERREEIEGAILAQVRETVPMPGWLGEDAEYAQGLREAVAGAVGYGLRAIELGQAPSSAEEVPMAALIQARRAARSGVSVEAVLRRYVLGNSLLWDYVMEEAARVGESSALRAMSRLQSSVLDRFMDAVTREYAQERERTGRSGSQRRLELVRGLLAGETSANANGDIDHGDVERELEYELDAEHVAVIARGRRAREALHTLAERLDRRLLCVPSSEQTVWAWLGCHQWPPSTGELDPIVSEIAGGGNDVYLTIGEPAEGQEGFRLTHRQAQAALVVAQRRRRALTRYSDVALLAAALKDEVLANALSKTYIAPLDATPGNGRAGAVLRQTLRAYVAAECNASSAAAALGVVRRTVENRLHTIEERLGRALHPCPPELEVALQLDELDFASS
jgi:hypothetical protein